MDIQFDGFQNAFPVFGIAILAAGLLALSVWTYWRAEGLTNTWRWTLGGLRSAAFLLLLLLLLNPVFSLNEHLITPVRIALLLDNSESVTIEKGDYRGAEHYRDVISHLTPERTGDYEHLVIETYGFDSELFPVDSPHELEMNGSRTDIDRALSGAMDILQQHEAVILVTDGIVTSGRDPSATASRIPVPVFAVGIGDTSRQNDVVVQRVLHNPTASLNSIITVDASILIDGFPDRDIQAQLIQDDTVLDEQTLRSSESRSVRQVRFDLLMEDEGLQQYRIHVPEVPGEWTTDNNTRWFSVDVRDDQLRILHLAYEVHPDVGNMRRFLREDKQILIESRTWITHDRYVEGDLPDRPDTLDLVVLHGFPHMDLDDTHAREIADRFSDNSILLAGSAGQDLSRLASLFSGQLPIRFQQGFNWQDVQFHLAADRTSHAILDFEITEDMRLPPIRGGIRLAGSAPNSDVLLQTSYRGNATDVPLLAVRTVGDRNITHLNGYNFYRWSLSTREDVRVFWENLLNNAVKWTAAQPDERLLDLAPSDPVFQIGEAVVMNGFLRNEAGDPEENASIEVTLEREDADDRHYIMSNEGGGRYQLEIGNIPEGTYSFTGVANRGGREIDSRSGQFSVGGINREFIETVRDDDLLRFIARASGGSFLPHEQAVSLIDIMNEQIGFEQRTETVSESLALYRHPFWFVLVIVLLATEWALRKYRALS